MKKHKEDFMIKAINFGRIVIKSFNNVVSFHEVGTNLLQVNLPLKSFPKSL